MKFYYNLIKAHRFFKRSISWSKQEILDYQNQKLIEMVKHAGENVPYYRDLFKEIGLNPVEFKGIQDIEKIPLLDKEEIRKDPLRFCVDGYSKYKGNWEKTSGSTGTPLNLRIDSVSKAYKYAAVIRAYRQAGYHLFKKVIIIQGYSESKKKAFGYRPISNSYFFNASSINEDVFIEFYKKLIRFSPKLLIGYARTVALMGHFILLKNLKFPKINAVINYGQNVPQDTIAFIKESFKCEYFNVYSHAENAALIHTFKDMSFKIAEDFFYAEFIAERNIDQKNVNELVATSFYNYAMPLIRYRTRDFVQIGNIKNESNFRHVEKIIGRIDDKIILPNGGHVFMAEGALAYAEGVVAAQYLQERKDVLKVLLVVDKSFKKEYFKRIEEGLVKRLGNDFKYEFEIVHQLIKNGSGKTPFIINKVKNK